MSSACFISCLFLLRELGQVVHVERLFISCPLLRPCTCQALVLFPVFSYLEQVVHVEDLLQLISSVVTHDWSHIVETCELDNWKEALAVILTYSLPEEFAQLCGRCPALSLPILKGDRTEEASWALLIGME